MPPHERNSTKLGVHSEGVIMILHFQFRAVLTMSGQRYLRLQHLIFAFSCLTRWRYTWNEWLWDGLTWPLKTNIQKKVVLLGPTVLEIFTENCVRPTLLSGGPVRRGGNGSKRKTMVPCYPCGATCPPSFVHPGLSVTRESLTEICSCEKKKKRKRKRKRILTKPIWPLLSVIMTAAKWSGGHNNRQ